MRPSSSCKAIQTRYVLGVMIVVLSSMFVSCNKSTDLNDLSVDKHKTLPVIKLPQPKSDGKYSLEEMLSRRRSIRTFKDERLTNQQLSQLLWATQGITADDGGRTAPSAGALYPLNLYVVKEDGLFFYEPTEHGLKQIQDNDIREELHAAALSQDAVANAPATFVFAVVYQRTAKKYGKQRAVRFANVEVGHAAQNLLLQAEALDLAGVPIGGFEDNKVHQTLKLSSAESVIYLIPIGHPQP